MENMRNGHVNNDFRRGIVCHWCSRSPAPKDFRKNSKCLQCSWDEL